MVNLNCCICTRYEEKLASMKNFRRDWIDGCTNQRKSCLTNHGKSEIHKAAMMHWKTTLAKHTGESHIQTTPVGQLLTSMDATTRERTARKFDICFVMAKESLPFTKYPALLALEQRHGVDLGTAYLTQDSAKVFTAFIAKS